jgi:hypothetical protein
LIPERVRPFAERLPFPTVVDGAGERGRPFDFDVVPTVCSSTNGAFAVHPHRALASTCADRRLALRAMAAED